MAAIAYPHPSQRPGADQRRPQPRHLTVVGPPSRRRPGRSRAAIYWRRRLVALVLLGLLLVAARAALGAIGGGPLAATEAPAGRGGAGADATYVVQPGDTWWSIARKIQPTGDVRALVDRLSSSHTGVLQPGERLALD